MGLWGGKSAVRCSETVGSGQNMGIWEKQHRHLDNAVRSRLKERRERKKKKVKKIRKTGKEKQKKSKKGESSTPVGCQGEDNDQGSG